MSPAQTFQENQKSEAARLLERGQALVDLKRYKDAEAALRGCLARDPQSANAHSFLAVALLAQADAAPEKIQDGLKEARKVIALRPDQDNGYYLLAWGHLCNHKPQDALDAAHQGMRINAQEVWGYSLVAQAYRFQKNWQKTLQAADTGLKIDPTYTNLLNLRAEALIMLDRKTEAQAAVMEALRSDPSSARAHANRGWLALYQGNQAEASAEAVTHFREALRLDPTSEASRDGLMQALHARSPLYRLVMRYFLWTRRASQSEFWAAMLLISGFNRGLKLLVRAFPPLAIIVLPYLLLYMLFSFFTWIAEPFFNLLLRLSPTGRQVLSREEANSASGCAFTGLLFLINAGAFIAALFLRPGDFHPLWIFLLGALLSLGMMVPVAGIFKVDPAHKKRRAALVVLAGLLGANAACGWGGSFWLTPWHAIPVVLFLVGWITYPWVANLIISIES